MFNRGVLFLMILDILSCICKCPPVGMELQYCLCITIACGLLSEVDDIISSLLFNSLGICVFRPMLANGASQQGDCVEPVLWRLAPYLCGLDLAPQRDGKAYFFLLFFFFVLATPKMKFWHWLFIYPSLFLPVKW